MLNMNIKNLINKAQLKNLITTYKDLCKTKLGKQTQLTKQEIDYYKKYVLNKFIFCNI